MDIQELGTLIETQGKAFEAFKSTHEESMQKHDALVEEKLDKIQKELDDAVEAKAAIEAKLTAEAKEREELELRLSRKGSGGDDDKIAAEVKSFNLCLKKEDQVDREGYDAYKSGFSKFLRKDGRLLTQDEVKAMSVGSDPDGGYLVTPDMGGRIVTKVFETSNIRQIAAVTTISTDELQGVEDLNEADAGWVGETDARTDTTTPQIGRWSIPVHELYAQPKATQKLLDDASVNVEQWLADKVSDKIARVENDAFVNGNGAQKPRGFADYPTLVDDGSGVAWGSIGHVVSGANGAFATTKSADAIFDLIGTVKDAYLGGSRFVTKRKVITAMRKFKDAQDQYLWQPSLTEGNPESFAGYPISRAEDIPDLATGSLSLWFGNFSIAYQIVDRIGIRVLRDPYTDKPYVKFYTTRRTGGGMVNYEAIKAMKFAA